MTDDMIPGAYRVTILVAPEDRDGRLTQKQVREFAETLGLGPGDQWDAPPETQVVEVAAPGAWPPPQQAAAGGPLFQFHEDRARAALRTLETRPQDYYGPELVTFTSNADDLHQCLDKSFWSEEDTAVGTDNTPASAIITALRPNATISIYPESIEEPAPVLAIGTGEGTVVLGGAAPTPADDLPPDDYTIAFLRECVTVANAIVTEQECAGRSAPVLDHTYSGTAIKLSGCHHVSDLGHGERLSIAGTFRVLAWLPSGGAVVGNGEQPEGIWATDEAPERAA